MSEHRDPDSYDWVAETAGAMPPEFGETFGDVFPVVASVLRLLILPIVYVGFFVGIWAADGVPWNAILWAVLLGPIVVGVLGYALLLPAAVIALPIAGVVQAVRR